MSRILVVEDDKQYNNLLTYFLQAEGYEVTSALNGREGLEFFERDRPDIVLTDIRMPKKDGLDLLLKFRSHAKCSPKGIILMSGFGNTHNDTYVESLKALGATEFLQKPFELADLKNLIEKILDAANSGMVSA